MVKLKYSEASSFAFAQAMQKITSTPTHGQKASLIHKITKQLAQLREKMSKEYQEQIVQVYSKKDEAGNIVRPEGEPHGFEPVEEKEAEFLAAQEKFGENIAELSVNAMTLDLLADVKVSAMDLEALKGMYVGNDGPGIPSDNVTSIGAAR